MPEKNKGKSVGFAPDDDIIERVKYMTDNPDGAEEIIRTVTEEELIKSKSKQRHARAPASKKKSAAQEKAASKAKDDWRKRGGAVKTVADAEPDDIPFAWTHPLIVSQKTYTSKLISRLNRERAISSDKMMTKSE